MTATDFAIPYYVRFWWGFGYVSILLGIVNFGLNIVTAITVKGIYIPLWVIPLVAGGVILFCISVGLFSERYDIENRISTHKNLQSNPEFKQMCLDIKEIKDKLNK
jgi:hypothetical protein